MERTTAGEGTTPPRYEQTVSAKPSRKGNIFYLKKQYNT